jgi:Ankyrin repeat
LKEDYGVLASAVGQPDSSKTHGPPSKRQRRSCSRLRRTSVQCVRDAHRLMNDNTEIAYFYLSEMVNCSSNSSSANKLSRSSLFGLLNEYGPHLRFNRTVSSGGMFLVEICRAKHVTPSVILKCVQELVEKRGALVNVSSSESNCSQVTPLCVAAARGLHNIVSYLLQRGADTDTVCSGRFALHTQPKKSVICRDKTAYEFAVATRQAEKDAGATEASLRDLNRCIRLLQSTTPDRKTK